MLRKGVTAPWYTADADGSIKRVVHSFGVGGSVNAIAGVEYGWKLFFEIRRKKVYYLGSERTYTSSHSFRSSSPQSLYALGLGLGIITGSNRLSSPLASST